MERQYSASTVAEHHSLNRLCGNERYSHVVPGGWGEYGSSNPNSSRIFVALFAAFCANANSARRRGQRMSRSCGHWLAHQPEYRSHTNGGFWWRLLLPCSRDTDKKENESRIA